MKRRKQQRIVEEGAVGLPSGCEKDDDGGLADEAVVPQQFQHRQFALDLDRHIRASPAVSRSRIFASPIARSLNVP